MALRLYRRLAVVVAVVLPLTLFAQTAPDFSGRWVLDPDSNPTNAGSGSGGGGGTGTGGGLALGPPAENLTITQDAQRMKIEKRGGIASNVQYRFDGKPQSNTQTMASDRMGASYRSRWEGATLLTEIAVRGFMTVPGRAGGGGGGGGGGGRGFGFGNTVPVSRDYREKIFLNPNGTLVVETSVLGGLGRTAVYKKAAP